MTSEHYKNTYNKLLNELPKWKQMAVKEDSEKNHWSGILTEFIKNVIYTAEKEFEDNKFLIVEEPVQYKVDSEINPIKKIRNKKR